MSSSVAPLTCRSGAWPHRAAELALADIDELLAETRLTDNGVGTATKDEPPAELRKPGSRPLQETLPRS